MVVRVGFFISFFMFLLAPAGRSIVAAYPSAVVVDGDDNADLNVDGDLWIGGVMTVNASVLY